MLTLEQGFPPTATTWAMLKRSASPRCASCFACACAPKRSREAYRERRDALVQGIAARLGDELSCGPIDSGLDICAPLRRRLDDAEVARRAQEAGVDLRPLSYYAHPAATSECAIGPGLLLGFAAVPPSHTVPALERLAKVLHHF